MEETVQMFRRELDKPQPDIARFSIALGLIEACIQDEQWPTELEKQVEEEYRLLADFVNQELSVHRWETRAVSDRDVMQAVANAIWAKLSVAQAARDAHHVQHVAAFTSILRRGGSGSKGGRRVLDCGGVVITTLAVAQMLGLGDDGPLRMEVSEDHCWIRKGRGDDSEDTIEVTVDRPDKRGLPVTDAAWRGWLYSGGHPARLDWHGMLVAAVNSMDPSITARKGPELDSEGIQELQARMLSHALATRPDLMYPAATDTLADLCEVALQDALDSAAAEGAWDRAARMLLSEEPGPSPSRKFDWHCPGSLFARAVLRARLDHGDRLWYPYSFYAGYLGRMARFVGSHWSSLEASGVGRGWLQACWDAYLGAMWVVAQGAGVLASYQYESTDEELYKDVEGVMEAFVKCFAELTKNPALLATAEGVPLWEREQDGMGSKGGKQASIAAPMPLAIFLSFLDGVCALFASRSLPGAWASMAVKAARMFAPEARAAAQTELLTPTREGLWWTRVPPRVPIACGEAGESKEQPVSLHAVMHLQGLWTASKDIEAPGLRSQAMREMVRGSLWVSLKPTVVAGVLTATYAGDGGARAASDDVRGPADVDARATKRQRA